MILILSTDYSTIDWWHSVYHCLLILYSIEPWLSTTTIEHPSFLWSSYHYFLIIPPYPSDSIPTSLSLMICLNTLNSINPISIVMLDSDVEPICSQSLILNTFHIFVLFPILTL